MRPAWITAGLAALAAMVVSVLPSIIAVTMAILAQVSFTLGAVLTAGSAWFARKSDEPAEKAAWAVVLLCAILLLAFGLSNGGDFDLPAPGYLGLFVLLGTAVLFVLFRADAR